MAKWYDILSKNVTEKVGEFVSEKLVPEEMEWWEKLVHYPMGIFDKKDMEKYDWLGDLSSRGWLGPVNQMGTTEGRSARDKSEGTAKGIKIAETVIPAAIAAIYGGGALLGGGAGAGAGGGAGGAGGGAVEGVAGGVGGGVAEGAGGAGAGSGGGWMQYLKYAKYLNMLKGGGGQSQPAQNNNYDERYNRQPSRLRRLSDERIDVDLSPLYM